MNGLEPLKIRPCETFSRSVDKIIKAHYKRDARSRTAFLTLLTNFSTNLCADPTGLGSPEPWPTGTYVEGWEFHKIRFRMPGLSGNAGQGRYMYLFNRAAGELIPLLVYTHEQYEERPSSHTLSEIMKQLELLSSQYQTKPEQTS